MPPPAQQLVGRTAELGSLHQAIAELQRGRHTALELAGEPGIGKTRLLAELGAIAEERGHLVLSGSASELEEELPFWVFVDALDEYVQSLEPHRLSALDEEARAELPNVLPSFDGVPGTAAVERYRTHRAVRSLLEVLAADTPVVLLLDDLHWADSGSIELLGALLRRPPAGRVLLALAARPRQLPERLAGALDRARLAGTLTSLDLSSLSADESRELLGGDVEPAAAAALHEQSGGNPFYLQQLARAPAATLAASLADELAALAGGARQVLEGASVAGDPFEPELAAAAAGVREDRAVEALDELLQRDLIRHTDVPRRFRFRHPLVRGAVYAATPGGWRLGAHERCAAALAARGVPATVRAHHVEHAGRHGDEAAIAVLCEAGDAIRPRAPDGAVRWYSAALRLMSPGAPPEQRIGLLQSLALALAATGRYTESRQALADALALVPPEANELRAGLVALAAAVDGLLSRHAEARARLVAEVERLEDRGSPAAAALMQYLAVNAIYRQSYADASVWAERAHAAGVALGDDITTAGLLTIAYAFAGPIAEAERHRAHAARVYGALSDERVAPYLGGLSQLSAAEFYLDRFAEGEAHAARALTVGRASGQLHLLPMLLPIHAAFLASLGRIQEARDLCEAGTEEARLTGNPQGLAWVLFALAHAELYAGDLDAALASAEESVEVARARVTGMVHCYTGQVLGAVLIEAGEPARGADAMLAHGGGPGLDLVPGAWRAYYLERLVAGRLALGQRPEAEAAGAAAAGVAAATGLRTAAIASHRAAARLALDARDHDAAAKDALAAAAAADEIHAGVDAALSRLLAGRAFAGAGRPDCAMPELQRAANELDGFGAHRWRAEAERELRKLGNRSLHRRTRRGTPDAVGVASLTERELQIARLIVDRRTNPQIAAELFLSPKTVESHVRNLFHKLGVSSRVEVARVVERADASPYG